MNRSSKTILLGFLSVLISGCGYRVAVTYLKTRQTVLPLNALSNVYMIVQRPDISGGDTKSKTGLQSEADLPVELDIDRFALKVGIFLRDRGGRLSAYRVQNSGEDTFAAALHPSALLYVNFESPRVGEEEQKEENEITEGDKKVKKDVSFWQVQSALKVRARLVGYSDNSDWGSGEKQLEKSKRFEDAGGSGWRGRFAEEVAGLIDAAANWTVRTAIPVDIVTRQRKLFIDEADKESKDAAEMAQADSWDYPTRVWKNRLAVDPKCWKDAWNLGVWAEQHRDYSTSRAYFHTAQPLALLDKKGPSGEEWAQVWQDLEQPLATAPSEPDHSGVGIFKMWSAPKNDFIWINDKNVSRQATTAARSGAELGWSFLQQLVGSWANKASHTPMAVESAYFVEEQLIEFPRRPQL